MSARLAESASGGPPAHPLRGLVRVWAWTVPVALLGSWTCFAARPGVNWTLWTWAAAAGFIAVRRPWRSLRGEAYPLVSLACACALAGAAAVTSAPHSIALVFLSTAALCAFALLAVTQSPVHIGPAELVRMPLTLLRRVFAEMAMRMSETLAAARMRGAVPLVRGGAIAIVLATVLFVLLSAADPILSHWREVVWSLLRSWRFLARDLFFLALACLLLGAYGLAARTRSAGTGGTASIPQEADSSAPRENSGSLSTLLASAPQTHRARLSDIERLMALGAALVLYGLFFVAELASRIELLSAGYGPPGGETFAQATHRGFEEMIVSAALCAAVIIAFDRYAARGTRERAVYWVSWGVIGASLLVVASAYARVRFYEAAYGYTELRLYVQVCCAAVSIALLLLAWRLRVAAARGSHIDLVRLTHQIALAGVACIASIAYWNSAAWIVNANIDRYLETGKLDVNYLVDLAHHSPDAVPTLISRLPSLTAADALRVRQALRQSAQSGSLLTPAGGGTLAWYEWSARRASARTALRAAGLIGPASSP